MRPDPYKQKASRRYQAAHRSANKGDAAASGEATGAAERPPHRGGSFARRKVHDNSWRFEDGEDGAPSSTADALPDRAEAAAAREEESIREFLGYLQDEADNIATDRSAAYFQLRAEADYAGIDAYSEETWKKLARIDLDGLLAMADETPVHELLGLDSDTALPDDSAPAATDSLRAEQVARCEMPRLHAPTSSLYTKAKAAEPVPKAAASSDAARKPQPAAPAAQKTAQSVDDLEAFLDELL
ncbi:hypothetical protein GGF46_002466 [Coemansia sp. RSA 552]|nr:hypothetical protein GGF46_002466 [Coemansia sp. RSA 552]